MKKHEILIGLVVVTILAVMLSGCSVAGKSWGLASSVDAFKAEIVATSNGTPAPSLVAGGDTCTLAFSKSFDQGDKAPPVISYAKRASLWGIFSSDTTSGNISICYIGGSNETPEQTVNILNAFAKVVNPEAKKDGDGGAASSASP